MDYKVSSCASSDLSVPQFCPPKVLTPLELIPLLKNHREGKQVLNLEGATLEGDFTGFDLNGLNFSHATLTNANLSFTNLSNSDLTGVKAEGAIFTHAVFYKTVLKEAQLHKADFRGAMFIQTNLCGALCQGALFHNATLSRTTIVNAVFSEADFTEVTHNCTSFPVVPQVLPRICDRKSFKMILKQLDPNDKNPVVFQLSGDLRGKRFKALARFLNQTSSCSCILKFDQSTLGPKEMTILLKLREEGKLLLNFNGVKLVGDFTGQTFFGLNLSKADIGVKRDVKYEFRNTKFIGCNLVGAIAQGGSLSGASFLWSEISGVNFFCAKMPHVVLANCTAIGGTQFYSTQMQNANFRNSEFAFVRFNAAKLEGSTFEGAKIRKSNFTRCDLVDSCWQDAFLEGTDIEKSTVKRGNLKGLKFLGGDLTGTSLTDSEVDQTTKFSKVFIVGAHFDELVGPVIPENWTLSWTSNSQLSQRSQSRFLQNEILDHFDHATNRESGSILSAIESMPAAFKPVQCHLLHQVIHYFHAQDEELEGRIYKRLADILLEAFSPHDEDPLIREVLQKHIYPLFIHRFQSSLQFYNHLVDEKEALAKFKMMTRFLLSGLDSQKDKESTPKDRLILLQNECYLMANVNCYHSRLSPRLSQDHQSRFEMIKSHWDRLVHSGLVMEGIDDTSHYFCFIRIDSETGFSKAVLIDHDFFPQFCDVEDTSKRHIPVICLNAQDDFWTFTDDSMQVLKSFPSVLSRLKQLEAGYALMPFFEKLIPEDIRTHFLEGMKVENRATSYFLNVGDDDYLALEAWGKTVYDDATKQALLKSMEVPEDTSGTQAQPEAQIDGRRTRINEAAKALCLTSGCAHFLRETISELVLSNDATAQQEEQIFLKLSLFQMMCYFSSVRMFGSESVSPLPIRFFAIALLNDVKKETEKCPANSLCKSLLSSKYALWVEALAGTGFSCTAILSSDIKDELKELCVKNQSFTQLYCLVIPELWR